MSEEIIRFRFRYRYRDERTGKILTTRYLLSEADARQHYGDRLVERLEHTRKVRQVHEHGGHLLEGMIYELPLAGGDAL